MPADFSLSRRNFLAGAGIAAASAALNWGFRAAHGQRQQQGRIAPRVQSTASGSTVGYDSWALCRGWAKSRLSMIPM